eukprot:2734817-Rhodomonas_salina.2
MLRERAAAYEARLAGAEAQCGMLLKEGGGSGARGGVEGGVESGSVEACLAELRGMEAEVLQLERLVRERSGVEGEAEGREREEGGREGEEDAEERQRRKELGESQRVAKAAAEELKVMGRRAGEREEEVEKLRVLLAESEKRVLASERRERESQEGYELKARRLMEEANTVQTTVWGPRPGVQGLGSRVQGRGASV